MNRRFGFFTRTVIFVSLTLIILSSIYVVATDEAMAPRFQCIRSNSPLIIHSGSKITLAAGGIYEFSSILIHRGGTLEIVGDNPEWTTIRTYGNLRLEGVIRSTGYQLRSKEAGKYYHHYYAIQNSKDHAIDTLSFTYKALKKGGKGGAGGRPLECIATKDTVVLKLSDGFTTKTSKGGTGGNGMDYKQLGKCLGKILPKPALSQGLGKKGGDIGTFGGLLFIEVGGDLIGDGGTIDVSGGKGNSGTDGESKKFTGGGGGGGGAGGNGGAVYFNVLGILDTPFINIDGGVGGDGGKGGSPHAEKGLPEYVGAAGEKGQSGNKGEKFLGEHREISDKFYWSFFTHRVKTWFGSDGDCVSWNKNVTESKMK